MVEHISIPVFHVVLKSIRNLEPSEQKKALTDAYEREAMSADDLEYGIAYLGLRHA